MNPSLPSSPGADTHFSGPLAITAFDGVGGASFPGSKVPVENTQGSQGTRDSHWREATFETEAMTGFVDATNPLSVVTVESLADLGYVVNSNGADPYSLPGTGPARSAEAKSLGIPLVDDIRRGPIFVVQRNGTIKVIQR